MGRIIDGEDYSRNFCLFNFIKIYYFLGYFLLPNFQKKYICNILGTQYCFEHHEIKYKPNKLKIII